MSTPTVHNAWTDKGPNLYLVAAKCGEFVHVFFVLTLKNHARSPYAWRIQVLVSKDVRVQVPSFARA
jgi:hypothetical protein